MPNYSFDIQRYEWTSCAYIDTIFNYIENAITNNIKKIVPFVWRLLFVIVLNYFQREQFCCYLIRPTHSRGTK